MRILLVGGGTLGSVTPLLAVAEELQTTVPNQQKKTPEVLFGGTGVLFWGTRCGPERALVAAAGIPFRSIPSGKLRRYEDIRNLLDTFVIAWAFFVAFVRLLGERPSVIVGAGSFVQVPVMWAAWVLRVPIIIHQLDVRSSLANRLIAPLARAITVTFPASVHAFRRARVIGAPVRRAVLATRDMDQRAAKRRFGFTGDRPILLVIGGGTGAQALNKLVWGALPSLTSHADVLHVTGRGKGALAGGAEGGAQAHYRSFELLTDDLPYAYAAADFVVARAGMGTIAELAAFGKNAAFVPMPGTHQEENAAAIAAACAAFVWHEDDLTPDRFVERVRAALRDRTHRGVVLRALFPSDAAQRLSAVIRHVAR